MEGIKVKLTKLKEADNPLHPNDIEVGYEKHGIMYEEPVVGQHFNLFPNWRTSRVQEIIDENTFRTFNSIYKIEKIE